MCGDLPCRSISSPRRSDRRSLESTNREHSACKLHIGEKESGHPYQKLCSFVKRTIAFGATEAVDVPMGASYMNVNLNSSRCFSGVSYLTHLKRLSRFQYLTHVLNNWSSMGQLSTYLFASLTVILLVF